MYGSVLNFKLQLFLIVCACLLVTLVLGVRTLLAQEDDATLIRTFKSSQYLQNEARFSTLEQFPELFASNMLWEFPGDGNNYHPIGDWTRVVAQAMTDSGWDIFTFKLDRTETRRLTSNAGANTNPAMDHFAKRVVYTSNRHGTRDLFLASAEGSGDSIQLTSGESQDDWASWSPDGSRIAFASNRTGDWEIYTMNADGSDVQQITHDPAAHDVMPSWSSQGVIAWVKRTGIQGTIWTANGDGTNATAVTRNYPYLSNPYWNYAGTAIAFDADLDKDYFNEIALVDLANQMFVPLYDGGDWQDVWVNAWEPADDGDPLDSLLLTRISYAVQDNQAIVTNIQLEKRVVFDPKGESEVIASFAAQADWRISDDQAPVVSVDRLSPYTFVPSRGSAALWVSGNDPGGSGIVGYQMQESINGGEWSEPRHIEVYDGGLVQYNPPQTGTSIALRVRAYDRAGNYGNWTDSARATSWYYRAKLVGQVVDVWGNLLDNVQVTAPGLLLSAATTDATGHFEAYAANSGDYTVQVSKPGYADRPPMHVTVTEANEPEINQVFRLLPRENIIANGDFESSALSEWQTIGSGAPTVVADAAYSGNGGLLLSQLQSASVSPHLIPNGRATRYGSIQSVYDAQGGLHVTWPVWYGSVGNFIWIYYSYCSTPENCLEPTVATDGETNALAVVGDKAGLLDSKYVGSESAVHLRYWEKEADGWRLQQTWTLPKASPVPMLRSLLWVDSNDQLHAMWIDSTNGAMHSDQYFIFYTVRVDGIWQPVQQLDFTLSPYGTDIALLNTDRNTTELYVEGPSPSSPSNSYSQIWRFEWNGTMWGNPDLVHDSAHSQIVIDSMAVTQDTTGMRHLLIGNYFVYHLAELAGGGWSAPMQVVGMEDMGVKIGAVWGERGLVAYRHGGDGFRSGGYYKVLDENGNWTGLRCISLPTYCGRGDVSFAVNPTTKQLVMTHRLVLPTDEVAIYVTPLTTPVEEPLNGVQRMLDLRSVPHRPVFDFMVKVQQFDIESKTDKFKVWVETDKNRTLLFESIAENNHLGEAIWQRRTLDLSPWAKQAVTLTMALENVVDGNLAAVHLDELSLGAWTTPIIQSAVVEAVENEQNSVTDVRYRLRITGVNLMPNATVQIGQHIISDLTIQDSSRLEVVLPEILSPGFHPITLVNPGGASAQFTVWSRTGHHLLLPEVYR